MEGTMKAVSEDPLGSGRLSCHRLRPVRPAPSLADDARSGLLEPPRSLPPKYFYDARGSRLFDRICDTPEYYPTRREAALLARHSDDIVARSRPSHLIELGSGTSRKTRLLFDACERQGRYLAYWPIDVCQSVLLDSGISLTEDYPWLCVNALAGDYLAGLEGLPAVEGGRLFLFLGGTIGNIPRGEDEAFLSALRRRMGPADRLLLGADRVKDAAVLHAAYNDASGITAEFNLNLLCVLNRELGAGFDRRGFAHRALYNAAEEQIEMYLVARRDQRVRIGALGAELHFAAGERLLTEISRKYTPESLQALLGAAGLAVEHHYEPPDGYFSLVLARPA
jgi:L-histidine Nalpha-methyltransferase